MTKRILVTGGLGFIGSNLVHGLLSQKDVKVTVVDSLLNGRFEWRSDLANSTNYKEIVDDFASEKILSLIKHGAYDIVYHLAAIPRVSYSVLYPFSTHEANVAKTMRLIEASISNIDRFVFASSSSVYGGADVLPTNEKCAKDPKSPYALQKSIIEDYLTQFYMHRQFESVSLRFFNVFGRHALGSSPYATALASWLTSIKTGEPMRSDGDGSQSRDLCHVDNVVHACILAGFSEKKLNAERYNVACGTRTTNKEILDYLMKRYPKSSKIDAPWREGDVMHTHADISKISNDLGYQPVVDVWQGVKMTCDWYDERWQTIKFMDQRV